MNNERYSYAMAPKQTEWTQTGDPKIGWVQHDCDNCKANAERIARLEAENETLQIWGQEAAAEVEALKADRDCAIGMLAEWCIAVDEGGSSWDYWDEYYKNAMYRPNLLRVLLDAAIDAARSK